MTTPTPVYRTRVWDLPTRVFHWSLLVCVVCLIVTGNVGGNAMPWHFRLGYCVLTLLLWRFVWGLVGGHWSRFASFIYAPSSILAYLQGRPKPEHTVGHNPMGAGSVFALLGFLLLQVLTGLFADDEIANSGPLTKFIANARVATATWYHKDVGKFILLALILLHVAAILFYVYKKKETLVRPMVVGDKDLSFVATASRDDGKSRAAALFVLVVCATFVIWLVKLGG